MSTEENIVSMRLAIKELQEQLLGLEEEVAHLWDRFTNHDHPYKPEPRYGRPL